MATTYGYLTSTIIRPSEPSPRPIPVLPRKVKFAIPAMSQSSGEYEPDGSSRRYFDSPSHWKKADLDALNVSYMKRGYTLVRMRSGSGPIDCYDMSPQYRQAISAARKQLEDIPLRAYFRGMLQKEALNETMGPFASTMDKLIQIIGRKTPPDAQPEHNKIHDEAMDDDVPDDDCPTPSSGGSEETTFEDLTKLLAFEFLSAVVRIGGKASTFRWLSDRLKTEMGVAFQGVFFKSGCQYIKGYNDGGLFATLLSGGTVRAHLSLHNTAKYAWPILSIETKRRRSGQKASTRREKGQIAANHAAQIFGAMLGQVCHPQFFEQDPKGYQESFVLFARHDKFALFYSRLPHVYLKWVHEGRRSYYEGQQIILQRSQIFQFRQPSERGKLFELIAQLLWYISSGRSHIGYCQNTPTNPIYRRIRETLNKDVRPMLDCIEVMRGPPSVQPLEYVETESDDDFGEDADPKDDSD